jgi:hypothetical protein
MSDTLCDVAFTGTREDPSPFQLMMIDPLLRYYWRIGYRRFHEGDCCGADVAVAGIARGLGFWIVAHPPTDDRKRAWFPADETREPLPYLHRNSMIVHESSVGLAMPLTDTRTAHSGTWSTVAAMRAKRMPFWIVGPVTMRAVTPHA